MSRSPRIEIKLSQQEITILDAEAAHHGCNRSELIRSRLFNTSGASPTKPSVQAYQRAVTEALRAANGAINRTTAEAITAAIINNLFATDPNP